MCGSEHASIDMVLDKSRSNDLLMTDNLRNVCSMLAMKQMPANFLLHVKTCKVIGTITIKEID